MNMTDTIHIPRLVECTMLLEPSSGLWLRLKGKWILKVPHSTIE